MQIKPIKTENDYLQALQMVEPYFDNADELTEQESDFLDVMVTLIESYESKHHRIELPDPIEAIKFRMEQEGLSIKDLDGIIGKPNRVYEIFNKTRPLSLAMIRKIHEKMNISADVLIQAV